MDPVVHKHHKIKFLYSTNSSRNTIPLLNIEQIEDVSKIYQYKKKLLGIQNHKPTKNNWIIEEEKEIKIELSAEQKIQQYKKNQYQDAINKKKRRLDDKDKRPKSKLQPTPLRKILKRMSNYTTTEDRSSSYLHEIKESQKQLHFVKCNPTRKRRIPSSASSDFRRSRILSLKDGLPIEIGNVYPTLQDKLDQMKPPPQPAKLTFFQRFQRTMSNFFSHGQNKNNNGEPVSYLHNQKIKQQKLINKAKINMNHSVDTVQKIFTTVGNFYDMKHKHKQGYGDIVQTWKVDRPRTHQIRSRNYNIDIISKNKKKNLLDVFRKTSQNIRNSEIEKSRKFYDQLLVFVLNKTKSIESLPLTRIICDAIRQQLEINLRLSIGFLSELIISVQKIQQKDDMAALVIRKTKQYIQSSS